MKILYISSLILKKSSSASIRNTGLIEGLIKNNCEVEILTLSYPEQLEDEYLKNKLKNIKIYKNNLKILNSYLSNKINIEKKSLIKNTISKTVSLIKPLVKDLYFFPDIDKEWITEFKKLNIDYNDYNLIISSSDTKTSHYIVQLIKDNNPKLPWFQIWGDPWSSDIGLSGLRKLRAKFKEKELIQKADKIFYVSPFTLEEMKNKLPKEASKMHYLARGFLESVQSTLNYNSNINITYTGVLNKSRDITLLLDKIDNYNLKSKQKISINIYGNISDEYLMNLKSYKSLNYHGSVDFSKIKEIYKNAHYLLFIDNGVNTTQIPGKIYDYLGTNKPIIALFEEKNNIYNYFKNKLKILSYTKNNLDLNEILKHKNGEVNEDFSNINIAKSLISHFG